jgi:hypothetical protein
MMMGIGMPINHSSAPLPKPIVASYVRAETTSTLRLKFRKPSPLQNADAAERYENQSVMCEAREVTRIRTTASVVGK